MTTTDTDALTERIAGKLCDPARHVAHWPLVGIDPYCGQCYTLAERVLPIIAVEVRKAKAEAWVEGAAVGARDSFSADLTPNPYRETGGTDDRR